MSGKLLTKKRLSNIELLKIIAMIMIAFCHAIPSNEGLMPWSSSPASEYYQWGMSSKSIQHFILLHIKNLGSLANVIFIICSIWFLCESNKIKANKIVEMISDAFTISVLFLFFTFLFNVSLGPSFAIKSLFPITFNRYWFVTCYILLYAIHPFLNFVIEKLNQRQHLILNIILFLIYSVICIVVIGAFYANSIIDFICFYFFVSYAKKYMSNFLKSKKANVKLLISGLLGWIGTNTLVNILGLHFSIFNGKLYMLNNFMNPFFFIISLALLNLFRSHIYINDKINYLSSLTLIFYLVNTALCDFIRTNYYSYIYNKFTFNHLLIWSLLYGTCTLVICTLISIIYNKLLQPIAHKIADKGFAFVVKIYFKFENIVLKIN
ncbi:MAG: acyltransferase family protein [Oscillospiraceae bacterium]